VVVMSSSRWLAMVVQSRCYILEEEAPALVCSSYVMATLSAVGYVVAQGKRGGRPVPARARPPFVSRNIHGWARAKSCYCNESPITPLGSL